MPDDDDGWGGTTDQGWGSPSGTPAPAPIPGIPPAGRLPIPPSGPASIPVSGPGQIPPGGAGHRPPRRSPAGRTRLVAAAAVVVIAAAVVLILVLRSNNGPGHQTAISSPSRSVSVSPTPSVDATPSSSSLLKAAPFGADCQEAPRSSYNTSAVVEQVLCSGPQVTSSVSAAGVAYAKFSSTNGLNAWYSTTILKDNGIAADSGNCQTGTTVATTRGAEYCEGPFTDNTGAANARQVVVRAPAAIMLTNGPNSSSADCPNSDYTLLVFTAPSQDIGAVVLTCSSNASVANAFESSLTSGAFDLVTH